MRIITAPMTVLMTHAVLLKKRLRSIRNIARSAPLRFSVPAGFDWPKAGTRREYLRARIEDGRVRIYKNQSSGVLRSAAWADGVVEVLEGTTPQQDDAVTFIPFSELLG